MQPIFKKRSMLIIVSVIIALFIFSILSIFYVKNIKDLLSEDINDTIIDSAQQGERHISHSINTDITSLKVLIDTLTEGTPPDIDVICKWLELFSSKEEFSSIAVCGIDGFGYTSNGDQINLYKSEYFQKALTGQKSTANVTEYQIGTQRIAYDLPIFYDDKVVGVLSAIKDIDYLDEILNLTSDDSCSTTYILNKNGDIISDSNGIIEQKSNIYNFIDEKMNKDKIKQIDSDLHSGETHIGSFHINGEEKLYAIVPVSQVDGWYYLNSITRSVVHEKTTTIIKYTLFLVVSFLVMLIIIFTVTNRAKNKNTKMLTQLAHIDQLTKISNWNKFKIECENILKNNPNQFYALISLDIDGFKIFNDIYGHDEGNIVLIKMAELLENHVLLGERCSRYSTDTFLVLLKYKSDQNVIDWINSFKNEVCASFDNYRLTLSFGIYKTSDHKYPIDIICDRANLARRTIKADQEREYAFYQDETRRHIIEVKEIENDMHFALENHQFVVYYQPKHSFSTGEVIGAEALVRWTHPLKGMVFPDSFIPVFEHNGFIVHLDMYVLEETCKVIKNWIDNGIEPIAISVNMSQIHLKDSTFIRNLIEATEKYGIPSKYIEIELTESAIFDNMDEFTRIVSELKRYGFTVSMDDFGSGYSSLNLLSELKVDVLKIDRLFLNKSTTSERGRCIVESVIGMAQKLGIRTVSEGVETKEQVKFLQSVGCDIAQGYFYSRPLSLETFEDYIVQPPKVID